MKTLDTYFADWTHIDVGGIKAQTTWMDIWCHDNLGMRGGKWDRYHKPAIPTTETVTRGSVIHEVYRFKNEQDAMLFVMANSGKNY